MTASPTVSIVIPMFNSAEWITDTLDSVLRQSYPPEELELLVLDDGSTDDSVALAREFLSDHSMSGALIPSDRNRGVGSTRNAGWRRARGEWIQFLDSDDLLGPSKIDVQARVAVQSPSDVAVVFSRWQHLELREGRWQPAAPIVSPAVEDETVVSILEDLYFGYVGPTLMRRSVLEAVGGFDESLTLGEDLDLMLRIALGEWRFLEAPAEESIFFHRRTPESLWRRSEQLVEPVWNHHRALRDVESSLRRKHAGHLPERARAPLAVRYSLRLDHLFEWDREAFRTTVGWIRRLGFASPPGTPRPWSVVSRLIGYERTYVLRRLWRGAMRRLVPALRPGAGVVEKI